MPATASIESQIASFNAIIAQAEQQKAALLRAIEGQQDSAVQMKVTAAIERLKREHFTPKHKSL